MVGSIRTKTTPQSTKHLIFLRQLYMAGSLISSLTSSFARLSSLYFAKGRGAACSANYIRCYRPSFKIRYISLYPQSRLLRLSFSSNAVARGGLSRSLDREDLVVLGIETSCDDTAAAVVTGNGEVLGQVVSSQEDLLSRYGGVSPKMAEEAHSLVIDEVVQKTLQSSKLTEKDLTGVAVTIGPGLSLCLRGGHNLLILARDVGHYVQLGTTIDDAIGEAYDKTARWLGLDMSKGGGPALEELARDGDSNSLKFKIPMRQYKDCNFSYAGLKTQVRLAIESRNVCVGNNPISSASFRDRKSRADIAASFQRVAVLHLEERCERAIEWAKEMEPSINCLVVSGGVASNQYVRSRLSYVVEKNHIRLVCPPPKLCTDNGVMVAWTGIEHFLLGRFDPPPPASEPEDHVYDIRPRWPLGEEYLQGKSEARSLKRARIHPSLTSIIKASTQPKI
ncbi:probable tRNA N6-adenosine threonylcarbamoyltransferase, mitochondrial isoform X3 [Phalaenopsis equestris]|uniref:probable tRNA N6-adenosine threonylcarbamoyltransferase, mitochondrial isoform X3 n=1 Tax=Phalaenopsis equestris TaxID=78828 RepID=UPI0009E2A564|nr:probable tRNA N6-adenosine threonylcarbamoyltransferase, mitochondrial isoform X3 [Phalaenopsis equestris]